MSWSPCAVKTNSRIWNSGAIRFPVFSMSSFRSHGNTISLQHLVPKLVSLAIMAQNYSMAWTMTRETICIFIFSTWTLCLRFVPGSQFIISVGICSFFEKKKRELITIDNQERSNDAFSPFIHQSCSNFGMQDYRFSLKDDILPKSSARADF